MVEHLPSKCKVLSSDSSVCVCVCVCVHTCVQPLYNSQPLHVSRTCPTQFFHLLDSITSLKTQTKYPPLCEAPTS
jgi:hypothetical protein